MPMSRSRCVQCAIAALAFSAAAAHAQLTPPPGAVQDTDRVREQADARTPISGVTTISQSGSYYLTDDVGTTIGPAIQITVSDVTLDLNGFNVFGPQGIAVAAGSSRVTIRNGSINQSQVFFAGSAIVADQATAVIIEDIKINDAGTGSALSPSSDPAIRVGAASRIERVTITDSGAGIELAGPACTVRDVTIASPATYGVRAVQGGDTLDRIKITSAGADGIFADSAVISNSTVVGAAGYGINLSSGIIEGCIVRDAEVAGIRAVGIPVRDCIIRGGGMGIEVSRFASGTQITGCTIEDTADDAIFGLSAYGVRDTSIYRPGRFGIAGSNGMDIENVIIEETASAGISLEFRETSGAPGGQPRIHGVTIRSAGSFGIRAETLAATISSCTINGAEGAGILVGAGVVRDSTIADVVQGQTVVRVNGANVTFDGDGIVVGSNGVVEACTVNGVENRGISVGEGSRVESCAVQAAQGDSIDAFGASIIGNTITRPLGSVAIRIGGGVADSNEVLVYESAEITGILITRDNTRVTRNTLVGVGSAEPFVAGAAIDVTAPFFGIFVGSVNSFSSPWVNYVR